MNRIKCEVLSDLENGVIDQMVAAQESGTQAAQTTNSRYVTALDVYQEYVSSNDYHSQHITYVNWLTKRLNAEKNPHCT